MFLVIVPLSTLPNWQEELTKWVPAFKNMIHLHHGSFAQRRSAVHTVPKMIKNGTSVIILTTYEMAIKDKRKAPLRQ
jgi:SNF2 family DNA or RNA helicase